MADGAVKMGLPRQLATRFAAQTLAVRYLVKLDISESNFLPGFSFYGLEEW